MEDCCYCQHRNSCMERSRCYPCTSYKKGMQQREFALYKRRLLSLIPGKLQDIPNREVKIKFFRSSLIEQIEKEKDWQFTGEQTAELIRMAIYPDLRSEEERMQYEDFLMNGLDRVMSENEK